METIVAAVVIGVAWLVAERYRAKRSRERRKRELDTFFTDLRRDPEGTIAAVGSMGMSTTAAAPASAPAPPRPGRGGTAATRMSLPPASTVAALTATGENERPMRIERPDGLPSFADIGGMEAVKQQLQDTVGVLLRHRHRARDYAIAFNGILLHGPPGTGKSHLARAIAGEYGMNLLHVSTGDLVVGVVGESARNVQRAFEIADANRPCLLFLDEFDSIAQRRDSAGHAEERRTVNQLLVSLEQHQGELDLVVVAATNDLDHLDPAITRPGRFDRHIRIDLPDEQARAAILRVHLARRPSAAGIDIADLARRTSGQSAAALAQIVEDAALLAFREATESGNAVAITQDHLLRAASDRGGQDRPTVEEWSWEDLILPDAVVTELQQVEALLVEPDLATSLGIDPPRGVLLTGPPGTGKTTIARVLAAQARASFYPVSAADVTSHWHGESERAVQRVFERARANRPSIVFIDEIDAIGAARGAVGSDASDRQLTQLLAEMDGLGSSAGVLVVAATNREDVLDPALVRGGRLSRTIHIPLPDAAARLRLLEHFTRRMPTVGVDLAAAARATEGMSGADLKAICEQAALQALVRARSAPTSDAAVDVRPEDFARAILQARGQA